MLDAHGGHAVGLVVDFDIAEDVGAFLLQQAGDFDGEQADFRVSVRRAAQFQEMPPSAGIPGDENLGFAGVGQNGARRLPSPLAPVARLKLRMYLLDVG